MYASCMKERLRLAHTAVAQRKKPSLKKVSQSIDVRSKKAASNRRLGEIKQQAYSPLITSEEFLKAGLQGEYQSLYSELCMIGRSNLSAQARHLKNIRGTTRGACYKEVDPKVLVRCLDSACAIVLDASKTLHTLLRTGLANNYEASLQKFHALRPLSSLVRKEHPLPRPERKST
jgi:hypothetical protein